MKPPKGQTIDVNSYRYKEKMYKVYQSMIWRCTSPLAAQACHTYINRKVHPDFLGNAGRERFFKELGPPPTYEHSLDRRDNSKDYEPGNIRWATATEQMHNRGYNNSKPSLKKI